MTPQEFINNIKTSTQHKSFYHFTDRANLQGIVSAGGILSLNEARRRGVQIPSPGGNQLSHELDSCLGLDDYVHLCFCCNHSMQKACVFDGRIKNNVWLRIIPDILHIPGVQITLDIANAKNVKRHELQQGIDLLDIEVIYTRTPWRQPDIKARLDAAERCEILVPNIVPLACILNPYG